MADGTIPVVDFSVMGLDCENPPSYDEESVKTLAEKIHTAFSTIGFVHLTNHGISGEEVSSDCIGPRILPIKLNNSSFANNHISKCN